MYTGIETVLGYKEIERLLIASDINKLKETSY